MVALSWLERIHLCAYSIALILGAASWALHFLSPDESSVSIFALSFIAIMPMADLLAHATDRLSSSPLCGRNVTSIIYATLGNFVELIVAILALRKNKVELVRTLLIGSIFNKLLIELGLYYLVRGLRPSQRYVEHHRTGVSLWSTVSLIIAVFALFFPSSVSHFSQYDSVVTNVNRNTTSYNTTGNNTLANAIGFNAEERDLLVSHPIAIIFICVYFVNLFRHPHENGSCTVRKRPTWVTRLFGQNNRDKSQANGVASGSTSISDLIPLTDRHPRQDEGRVNGVPARFFNHGQNDSNIKDGETRHVVTAGFVVLVLTVLIGFTAEFMVDALDTVIVTSPLGEDYLTRIVLPLVGNMPEIVTAVFIDSDLPDTLGLEIAAQSVVQMVLGVISVLILAGWMIHVPMTFVFDLVDAIALMIAAMAAFASLEDAPSTNTLRGTILICLFMMYALSLWYYSG